MSCTMCKEGVLWLCKECTFQMVKRYKDSHLAISKKCRELVVLNRELAKAAVDAKKEKDDVKLSFKHMQDSIRKAEIKIKAYENQIIA